MSQPFAIWLLPSHGCRRILKERIQTLSASHGAPIFNPHCTLCSGITENVDSVVEHSAKASGRVEPFKIPTERIGYRGEFFQTLFVSLRRVQTLCEVRSAFMDSLCLSSQKEYMPHISLLYARMTLTQKSALASSISLPLDWVTITSAAVVIPDNPEKDWNYVESWKALAHFEFEEKKEEQETEAK